MNSQQFVDWIRDFLQDKTKLKKKEVAEIKMWLACTYNHNNNDIFMQNWDIINKDILKHSIDTEVVSGTGNPYLSDDTRPFPRIYNGQ